MTYEELISAFSKSTQTILESNRETMREQLLQGINDSDSTEMVYTKMLINSIDFTTHMSIQCVLGMLKNLNVIDPADYKLRDEDLTLRLVWDSSKHQHEDN